MSAVFQNEISSVLEPKPKKGVKITTKSCDAITEHKNSKTALTRRVRSIDISNGEQNEFDSIANAAKYILSLDKFKKNSSKCTQKNIGRACREGGTCCERKWEYVEIKSVITLNESWTELRNTKYYFSKEHNYYINKTKNSQVYGDERGKIRLPSDQGSLPFIDALWITFNGEIPKHKHVVYNDNSDDVSNEKNYYNNIKCVEFICEICNTKFDSKDKKSKYCSEACRNRSGALKRKHAVREMLRPFIAEKIKRWKKDNNLNADEVIEKVPGIKDLKCQYCGMTDLQLCSERNVPNKLSIDAKIPGDHSMDNLVCACWFCNRMKNDMPLPEWEEFIRFAIGEQHELDLSNKKYTKYDEKLTGNYTKYPWALLNDENKEMFEERGSNKKYFKHLYETQNGKDAIFGVIPLIQLDQRNKYNASCDNVNNNTKWQLIPALFNYGKSTLNTEEFKEEFKKRGWFLTPEKMSVKIPESYHEDSYFIKSMNNNGKKLGMLLCQNK